MHQFFIITSLHLLLPVIQTIFFSVPRFTIRRRKKSQKLNVFFLDQNRRNYRLYGIYLSSYIYIFVFQQRKHMI
jgi:hypothetical protein